MSVSSTHSWSAIGALLVAGSLAPFASGAAPAIDPVALHAGIGVSRCSVQPLEIPARNGGPVTIFVDLGHGPTALALTPHSVRADSFELLIDSGNGRLTQVEAPSSRTFKGEAFELIGGSTQVGRVRASLLADGLWAQVWSADGKGYGIQPVASVIAGADPTLHAVYEKQDILPGDWTCGVDGSTASGVRTTPADKLGPPTLKATGLRIAEMAIDADFEFFQKNGSSVTTTTFDIENVMNGVEGIYEGEVQITYEVTAIVVRTTAADPYTTTDPDMLLDQFRAEWLANEAGVKRDHAHLFTGKSLAGSVIGIAWLSVVCNNNLGFGLSESKWSANFTSRISLTAHEAGHNWSAQHCNGQPDCGIMCSGLGGCTGQLTKFGVFETNQITNWKNTHASCLPELQDSIALPFADAFATTSLGAQNWAYNDGGAANTNASNEPSAPNALNLDSTGAGAYDDDQIRTGFLLAAGAGTMDISYKVERIGVEAGETLFVDYWNNAQTWVNLNTLTSDGVDQSTFTTFTHALPANGKHNELRLRFRTDGNDTGDDWYIDDVAVGAPPAAPPVVNAVVANPYEVLKDGTIGIQGSHFIGATQVTIGPDTLASGAFAVADDTNITVSGYIPSTLGAQNVQVTTPIGASNVVPLTIVEADPPQLIVPVIVNNGSVMNIQVAGGVGWTAMLVVNTSLTTFTFNGATWLSALITIPVPPLGAVGYQNLPIPLSGVPAGTSINTQYWLFPPGATSASQAKVTNIGSTLTIF